MIVRLPLIYLSLFFSLAGSESDHKCKFPGDCLTHDTTRTDLPCERKSDRWQRFQDATPAEREQMRARWREPMRERIIRIYEVDASQEKRIRKEVDAIYARHCAGLDALFEEAKRLDEAMRDYAAAFKKRWRKGERDDSMEAGEAVLRRLQDDPQYQDFLDRRREIEGSCQIDWNDALKTIEKRLPQARVLKGRGRLAAELPHRCCRLWIEDAPITVQNERKDAEAIHPWEAHVQRFIELHRLSAGQTGAARSILREVRRRAAQVDRQRFEELAAAHDFGDGAALPARVEEFELRTDDLFDELNMRLDALLTTSQRDAPGSVQQDPTAPAG